MFSFIKFEVHVMFKFGPVFLQICAEFTRITTIQLKSKFYAQLDKHIAKLLTLMRPKGGAQGRKIQAILDGLDDEVSTHRVVLHDKTRVYKQKA